MNIHEIDRKIQLEGGKNAGAAKMLLRKLLQRGNKGFNYSSLEALNSHADVRILLDLDYAQVADGFVFAGREFGCKLVINPKYQGLHSQNAATKRSKKLNKKKAFLWREREIRDRKK